jgi:succinyl-CoA synthetase beta subunit
MDLFEYQGKQYFAQYNIPVSAGGVATTVDEAVAVALTAKYPVVVKAQVHAGGRGKGGGVKLAKNLDEVKEKANEIIGIVSCLFLLSAVIPFIAIPRLIPNTRVLFSS